MELHTFSSLNSAFLDEYKGTMDCADIGVVYFNPQVIEHKKLEPITKDQVKDAFGDENLIVITDQKKLIQFIKDVDLSEKNLLLMSSGNFSGVDLKKFAEELLKV